MKIIPQQIKVKTETGAYDIEASATLIGDDLLVAIWGGDKPHIGAVSAAQPRPSRKNPECNSATASVICFPAHKEHEIVRVAAEVLAAELNTHVVVTAGVHWDDISQDGIKKVMKNSKILIDIILKKVLALGKSSEG